MMASIKAYTTKHGRRYRVDYVKPDGRNTSKRGFKRKPEAEEPEAEEWVTRCLSQTATGSTLLRGLREAVRSPRTGSYSTSY